MNPSEAVDEIPYTSLAAVRAAHLDLLREFRAAGGNRDDTVPPGLVGKTEQFVRDASRTGTFLDREADQREAQGILDAWVTRLYRSGRDPGDITLAEFDKSRAPELPDAACPYLGLNAFTPERADVFFGRQTLIDELIGKIGDLHLLAVVGQSGSGKSSIVLAGILPRLMAGALKGSQSWRYFDRTVPGSDPLRNLAGLFTKDTGQSEDDIIRALRKNPAELKSLLERTGATGRVLFIDQFEEIFTLCQTTDDRLAYQANLANAAVPGNAILLTMRLDYLERLDQLPELRPIFKRGLQLPGGLTRAELTDAILLPAAKAGLKFDDGVVKAIVSDIEREPAALPLLQVMLLRMWEKRERNRITMGTYKMVGGPRALENAAEEFYSKLLTEDQTLVKRILCRMVRSEGELVAVARRVRRTELRQMANSPVIVDRILDKLLQARLVRLTRPEADTDAEVELAHEALVRNWGRLGSWIDEMRRSDEDFNRLELRAHEWERLGHGSGGLLDAVSLKMWEKYTQPDEAIRLSDTARQLLEASRKKIKKQAASETQQKWFLVAVAMIALMFAGGAIANWHEAVAATSKAVQASEHEAEANRKAQVNLEEALTQKKNVSTALTQVEEANKDLAHQKKATDTVAAELAAANKELSVKGRRFDATEFTSHANAVKATEPNVALLLAIQAARITHDADNEIRTATQQTLRSLIRDQSAAFRIAAGDRVFSAAFSPDARFLALLQENGTVDVWDVFSRRRVWKVDKARAQAISFGKDGVLAAGQPNGTRLVRLPQGQETLVAQPQSVTGLAFGPDDRLATAAADGKLRLFRDGRLEHEFSSTSTSTAAPGLGAVVWSGNGRVVAAITGMNPGRQAPQRAIHIWSTQPDDQKVTKTIPLTGAPFGSEQVRSLSLDDVGTTVTVTTESGRRFTFLTSTGRTTSAPESEDEGDLDPHEDGVSILGPAPPTTVRRAAILAQTPGSTVLALFEDESRHTVRIEQRVGAYVMAINPESGAFTDNGGYVLGFVDSSAGVTVEVRDVLTGELLVETDHDKASHATISRDGRVIAIAGSGVKLIRPGQRDQVLAAQAKFTRVALSGDGSKVAAMFDDGVILWDAGKLTEIRRWPARATGIAVNPRGDRLAVVQEDGSVSVLTADGVVGPRLTWLGEDAPHQVVFDSAGTRIAASGGAGVRVWDAVSGAILFTQKTPQPIVDLRFSKGGQLLAGATSEDGVTIWNLTAGTSRFTRHQGSDDVVAVGFTGDSQHLLTLDDYGHVAIREADTAALVSDALLWLTDGWSPEQCRGLTDLVCPLSTPVGRSASEVARGNRLAEQGDRSGALAAYRRARELDPGIPLDPETQLHRVVAGRDRQNDAVRAAATRAQARLQARQGELSLAETSYAVAAKLARNPFLNPREEARIERVRRLDGEAMDAMNSGDHARARTGLDEALRLLSGLEAPRLRDEVTALVDKAVDRFVDKRQVEEAMALVAATERAITQWVPTDGQWNAICWYGSLKDAKTAQLVAPACEKAVKEDENDPNFLDSRGLNRALLGDSAGAIADFEFFIRKSRSKAEVVQRQGWVEDLKAGRNPFTPEVLRKLREGT
jgi:WD40 repeat protein/tetratricopeptide (TPR) repeat protein